jgi:pimeloyl-ACP methyl ester carboxylesterase
MQTSADVVVLVPGFLGFARFGGFYYFAERVVAVLRGVLEERLDRAVPVVPCTTQPAHALANRQRHLLAYLTELCTKTLSGVERIHLVGHSTGGVDAQLLACTTPIGGGTWDPADDEVRQRIKSVVTISAPHHGTCLADSWLGYWAENPILSWPPIVRGIVLGYHVLRLAPQEIPAVTRVQLAKDVITFLMHVMLHRELIADIRPAHMEKLRSTLKPEPGVALTCFVAGTEVQKGKERPAGSFFTDMYDLTKGDGTASAAVDGCRRLLQHLVERRPELVIRSEQSRLPDGIHVELNDGVVNTVRQVVDPDDPAQLGGFVVGDHADVLGHYDRQDSLIGGNPYNAGLFHSGAGFGDDEFFKLYRRVGEAILRSCPSPGGTTG